MGYLSMDATTTQEPAEAQAKSSRRGRPRAHGTIEVASGEISMIPTETQEPVGNFPMDHIDTQEPTGTRRRRMRASWASEREMIEINILTSRASIET